MQPHKLNIIGKVGWVINYYDMTTHPFTDILRKRTGIRFIP